MAKVFRACTAGMAAAIVAVLVGCSSNSTDTASAPNSAAPADNAAAESTEPSTEFRVVDNATLPAPGADPMTMIFSLRQPPIDPIGSEQIRVNYPEPDKAVVTVTRNDLPDDSVRAIRTRYEFVPAEGSTPEKPLWEAAQVTEQNKCQPGRGIEDWSGELCQ